MLDSFSSSDIRTPQFIQLHFVKTLNLFRELNINIDNLTHGVYWLNAYNSFAGVLPFTDDHCLLIATGDIATNTFMQCALSVRTKSFKIRYNPNAKWTNWM